MRRLINDCHETPPRKHALKRRAWQLFQALVDRRIVEWIPREASGRKLRVNLDLQADFSLHQALFLYLIDTLPLLDRASADYPSMSSRSVNRSSRTRTRFSAGRWTNSKGRKSMR